MSTEKQAEIKQLKQENAERRGPGQIPKTAPAFLAELDRPQRHL